MTRTTQNTAALNAYITAQQQAQDLLAQLAQKLDAHQDGLHTDEIHWGHVGDINAIIQQLQQAVGETE